MPEGTERLERGQQKWNPVLRPTALQLYESARDPGG
jgi:hypothetical protein